MDITKIIARLQGGFKRKMPKRGRFPAEKAIYAVREMHTMHKNAREWIQT